MNVKFRFFILFAAVVTVLVILYYKSKASYRIERSVGKVGSPLNNPAAKAVDDLPPFKFDDIWDPKFSYSTFYPSWVSASQYLYRDTDGIKKYDLDSDTFQILVTGSFYESTGGNGWSISQDEQFLFVRTDYIKQWRHSYNASYAVYRISDEQLFLNLSAPDVQYIRWSPSGHGMVWVRQNDLYFIDAITNSAADIVRLTYDGERNKIFNGIPDWVYEEEMVSSTNNIFWSPDSQFLAYLVTDDSTVSRIEFAKYNDLHYPEIIEVAYPKAGTPNPIVSMRVYHPNSNKTTTIPAPVQDVDNDHLFCEFYWYDDSEAFIVYWLNRISNKAVPQLCQWNSTAMNWECSVIQAGVEESSTGWIGNGGTPFRPVMQNGTRSYFAVFSNREGYWQIAFVDVEAGKRMNLTTGTSVVTSLQGYDNVNNWLYFIAAHPLPRTRQLYRIPTNGTNYPLDPNSWECMTCNFDQDRCQWISPSFSPTLKYLVVNCGGPDVPMSTLQQVDMQGNYGMPAVMENNDHLITNKASVKWPIKEYGEIQSKNGIKILYQLHKPMDFDENKQYPLLIEVYGGPGFQKVQDRWTRSWAPVHMVSQYDIIVVSLDGRGSGYRGDGIAHMLYKKIGQLEKEDTTEVGQYFAEKPWIDENRLSVWGWSYGGYTTTFTISLGTGVFKCGLAVAPLATRFLYDSIHTERYMTLPKDNVDGYEKCSILNSNLENFNLASYSIIHGTADDNVHFQNAALISKALVAADVDFDNFFYADEAHSINSGPNANSHVYKLLTKKVRQCFNLAPPTSEMHQSQSSLLERLLNEMTSRAEHGDSVQPIALI